MMGKNRTKSSSSELFMQTKTAAKREYVIGNTRKTALDLISPNGIDDRNLGYLIVHDAGRDVFCCGLYISRLPRSLTIASHFSALFNFQNTISNVFIEPQNEGSIGLVNKRIDTLEGEIRGAEKDPDGGNRLRELRGKQDDADKWARIIESGENTLYKVGFLFILMAYSLDELRYKVAEFEGVAKKKNFELMACYGAQLEAFLSALPLNKIQRVRIFEKEPIGKEIIKRHIMDKNSLSTIFDHTSSEFNHRDGVPIGRNLYTGMPTCLDPFDRVHTSYGMVVAGMPGAGKSATIKELYSRLVDFDYHFALIDFEPHPNGKHGEYAPLVEALGGINYTISAHGDTLINLFELNEEMEYDSNANVEYRTLRVLDKVVDVSNILLAIATSIQLKKKEAVFSAENLLRMDAIISRVVRSLYEERGIYDGEPDSLYTSSNVEGGKFHSGKKRKKLPTQHDFYMKLLRSSRENVDRFKEEAYGLLLDAFEDTVRELYYCPFCLKEYSREEYESLRKAADGERWCVHEDGRGAVIRSVKGSKPYLDCESTVRFDLSTPIVSFDLSKIPESERPIMVLVAQNFIQEYFIKTNSSDPRKARKLLMSTDEAHKIFPYEGARVFLNSLYRTARKKHVGPILIMQSVADLARYSDTEDIVKNTETFLLFKHNFKDRDYIKSVTDITESQVEAILNLGGNVSGKDGKTLKNPGEFCLVEIPTKRISFIKADYLRETESWIVETDAEEIARLYERRGW